MPNDHVWAYENPHVKISKSFQEINHIDVRVEVTGNQFIGIFIFGEIVYVERRSNFLQNHLDGFFDVKLRLQSRINK